MRMNLYSWLLVMVLSALSLSGCSAMGSLASQPPTGATPAAEPLATAQPETAKPQSETPAPTAAIDGAERACSQRMGSIPLLRVKSGEPTVAGAYDVTGTQLTNYFVRTFDQSADQSNGSVWWNKATERAVMCLYDGDFQTMTPGPEGHNTRASRVLVVISQGEAEFWASTIDKLTIPAVDPASLGG